ncbi:hypothetical protein BT69DRAFT_1321225 [Atractiella rhizophila]|nr:hypothetical protein BT69DRAFT_1321225 [Atractiella rhizophila]
MTRTNKKFQHSISLHSPTFRLSASYSDASGLREATSKLRAITLDEREARTFRRERALRKECARAYLERLRQQRKFERKERRWKSKLLESKEKIKHLEGKLRRRLSLASSSDEEEGRSSMSEGDMPFVPVRPLLPSRPFTGFQPLSMANVTRTFRLPPLDLSSTTAGPGTNEHLRVERETASGMDEELPGPSERLHPNASSLTSANCSMW